MVQRSDENSRSGENGGRPAGGRPQSLAWLLTGAAMLAATALLPPLEGLTRSGMLTLGILLLAVVFWSTEAVNANVTALIILVLLPVTGALSYKETFVGLGKSMIWRLVGILIITTGLTQTGLDRRIAIFILRLARGNVYAMLVLLTISSEILVFFVPMPPARTRLLGTIYLGILTGLDIRPPSNLGKIIFIGIPIFAVMTSASVITGASVEIYSLGLFSTLLHHDFTYVTWMLVNLPVTFLICFLVLPVLIRLFPPETMHLDGAAGLIEGEIRKMGALTRAEGKMLALFAVLLVLWFSGVSDRLPAELLIASVMFMPGVGILTWRKAQDGVPWGMIVLYGSSLALALALQQNGVVAVGHGDLYAAGAGARRAGDGPAGLSDHLGAAAGHDQHDRGGGHALSADREPGGLHGAEPGLAGHDLRRGQRHRLPVPLAERLQPHHLQLRLL